MWTSMTLVLSLALMLVPLLTTPAAAQSPAPVGVVLSTAFIDHAGLLQT